MIGVNLMSEHLILSVVSASAVSFIAVAAVFAVVYEIRRNSDGNVYFVTPDHYCGHGEKEEGVSDA